MGCQNVGKQNDLRQDGLVGMSTKKIAPPLTVEKFKEMVTELSHLTFRKKCEEQ